MSEIDLKIEARLAQIEHDHFAVYEGLGLFIRAWKVYASQSEYTEDGFQQYINAMQNYRRLAQSEGIPLALADKLFIYLARLP